MGPISSLNIVGENRLDTIPIFHSEGVGGETVDYSSPSHNVRDLPDATGSKDRADLLPNRLTSL